MRRPDPKAIFAPYAVAWAYLAVFVAAEVVYALMSPRTLTDFTQWASTNVHNLGHDPIGSLVVSAFVTQEFAIAWPALIALAMFGANKALGNWRTVVVCASGQVIGTLVSEGIVGYRVSRGLLPSSARYIVDVGPSYVVVAAAVAALLYGSWLWRAAAAVNLTLMIGVGDIFGGLSNLSVPAVGHLTAMTVGAIGGGALIWQRRERGSQRRALGEDPAPGARSPG